MRLTLTSTVVLALLVVTSGGPGWTMVGGRKRQESEMVAVEADRFGFGSLCFYSP